MKGEVRGLDAAGDDRVYRIGELAARFGVTSRTIRYYEELGLLEPTERGDGGHRKYDERNSVHLKRIQQLKDYGLTLSEIRELFDLARKDRSGDRVRKRLVEKYREKLAEAERRKRVIEDYIDDLSWHIDQLERVSDFFECPGASCAACSFAGKCDMRTFLKKA